MHENKDFWFLENKYRKIYTGTDKINLAEQAMLDLLKVIFDDMSQEIIKERGLALCYGRLAGINLIKGDIESFRNNINESKKCLEKELSRSTDAFEIFKMIDTLDENYKIKWKSQSFVTYWMAKDSEKRN